MAVDSLATVAFETLRDLLVEEVKFLSGVSDEVKEVERDLRTMHSLLMDADKWSGRKPNKSLCNWINDLKDLASKAENVLEKYAVEVESKKEGRNLKKNLRRFACILCECFSVHEVGKEIEDVRSRLTGLTDRLRSMSGGEGSSNSANEDLQHLARLTYAHEVEEHFVGMEEDIERLVSMVKDEKRCSPVISIYGMGGLGKTTLARKIYNHRDVQGCFDARAWVCVTQQFEARAVLSQILKKLLLPKSIPDDKEEQMCKQELQINELELPELVVQLHSVLLQKKCLIVIDDIWEIGHWDILKPAFPNTNCKVLLTTRKENIISQECAYKLDCLTEDQGWELLRKIAILKDDAPGLENGSRSLEDTGRQIVQKCGLLPLAISVIGGILRQKQQTLAEWDKVRSNIDSYLKHGEGIGNDTRVKQVLDLSYDVLPYYLKPCFLYLGGFPEDQEIEAERLYLLWMAEGLISSEQRGRNYETLRDVAERYLTELAFRCMVQVQKDETYTPHNRFESCRLHDLMHDLCSSKAEEEKFLKRIDFYKHPDYIPSSIGTPLNRLAICVDGSRRTTLSNNGIQKLEDLRSFTILCRYMYPGEATCFQNTTINFDKSKYLRILILDNCEFEDQRLPSNVSWLIHLRYLSLNDSDVEELPPSICYMPYLQALDLRVKDRIKLPNVICKMKRLRHLFLGDFDVIGGDELRLEGLKELETLHCGSGRVCIADIRKLTNLRELTVWIRDVDNMSIIADLMRDNLSQLRATDVDVHNCDLSSEEGTNVFKNFLMSPSLVWLRVMDCKISCGFPCYKQGICENLAALDLENSVIGEDVMEKLGKYPMLQFLTLYGIKLATNTEMICRSNSFRELKSLLLSCMNNLKKWEVEEGAMPKLTKLAILNCSNLEMVPDGLRFIATLRELVSYGMPKELNDRLRVVDGQPGEDYHKVSHIPSIHLINKPDEERSANSSKDDEAIA